MKRLFTTVSILLYCLVTSAQNSCINHWSQDSIRNYQLDSIFLGIDFGNTDSVICDPEQQNSFDSKGQIDFFNKQIGKYFTKATAINFIRFYSKEKGDDYFNEVHIFQFSLPEKDLRKFKEKYGDKINGYGFFNINVFTLYRYVVKGGNVYFICTESYERGNPKTAVFYNKIFDHFVNYRDTGK